MPLSSIDITVANELSSLVETGLKIKQDILKCGFVDSVNIKCFQTSSLSILQNRFGENSSCYKEFLQASQIKITENSFQTLTLPELATIVGAIGSNVGTLKASINALENGLADGFFYQKEMIVCNDLLDQANEFLENQSTYLAAGVYGRVVLETSIREFAKLKLHENYNKEMKFDALVSKLRTGGHILQSFEFKLKSYYTIGSHATHNNEEFKKYTKKDLKEFLVFIKNDVLTLT